MYKEHQEQLRKLLSPPRFAHSLRVAKTAAMIAERHGVSADKAYLAGLLHDNARELSQGSLRRWMKKVRVRLRSEEKAIPALWHAFVGEVIAREKFGIRDREVLEAVRWHTSGDASMGPVAKCVYIADLIEPKRRVRRLALENLDDELRSAVAWKISYSLKHGTSVLTRGVDLWNMLVTVAKKR